MKQETIKTKVLIMGVCAFAATVIAGMFAAAGYL
jgi:hypothetical protein